MQRRSSLISSADCSGCTVSSPSGERATRVAQFEQEFLWRNEEWILLQDAADQHHRMRTHDVHHRVTAELRRSYTQIDHIVVATPHVVYTRFELDEIVDVRPAFCRPVHLTDDATQPESFFGVTAAIRLNDIQHSILIEAAVAKIGFGVGAQFELTLLLRGGRIDPRLSQPVHMVTALIAAHDVNRLVTALEPVPYERKQHTIFFVVAVEERAHMARFAEFVAGKWNCGDCFIVCWPLWIWYHAGVTQP